MQLAAGKILISSDIMDDPNFKQSIIFISEYNEKGAMAFVINKIAERPLNELIEFNSSPTFPLYHGGPVDQEHLFFIHRRIDLIFGGTQIVDNIYFGGNFKQAVASINNKLLTEKDIKLFIGYCGWDNGELEAEILEGSWLSLDAGNEIVFS